MPTNNALLGITKTLKIAGNYVLAKSANRSRRMSTEPVQLLQGTPKTRIFDIGVVEETFKIDGPMLIGGASSIDVRQLLLAQLTQALDPNNTSLPIVTGASVSVDKDSANVSVSLLSDGNPANSAVFEVMGADPNGAPLTLLNPTGGGGPTRLAKWYDFRVNIGGYKYYIQNCKLEVKVGVEKSVFIAGVDSSLYANVETDALPSPTNPYNWGTQYQTFGIKSISINGDCKALVLLSDAGNASYNFLDLYDGTTPGEEPYAFETGDEALNINWGTGDLSYQAPGQVIPAPEDFVIEIFVPSTGWVDIMKINPTDSTPVVNLSKSLITAADLSITTGLVTVSLNFVCWVI